MTPITDIYDVFLSKISDYTFLMKNVTEDELNEELFGYFKSARAKFYKCKNSLKTKTVVNKDEEEVVIEGDLSDYEIEVIVKLMLVEYMTPQVLSSEVIKQSLSDKDFRIYSQANQLRELNLLYRLMQKEATKMITEYTFIGMTDKK